MDKYGLGGFVPREESAKEPSPAGLKPPKYKPINVVGWSIDEVSKKIGEYEKSLGSCDPKDDKIGFYIAEIRRLRSILDIS